MEGGVVAYTVLCTLLLLLVNTWLLRRYAHHSVTRDVLAVVWLSWTASTVIIYVLPLDLRPGKKDHDSLFPFYAVLYWICFFLTWILTPFQQAYKTSGNFTPREKAMDALRFNVVFLVVAGVALVIGFIYLLVITNFTPKGVAALLQSLGNLWGLSLAILTVSYGLVEIPRYFWYRSHLEKRLDYLYWNLAQLQHDKEEAKDRVEEYIYLFNKAKDSAQSSTYRQELRVIQESIPLRLQEMKVSHPDLLAEDIQDAINSGELNKKLLGKLHTQLKIWIFEKERSDNWWLKTAGDILILESMLEHKSSSRQRGSVRVQSGSPSQSDNEKSDPLAFLRIYQPTQEELRHSNWCFRFYWWFRINVIPLLQKAFAICLALLSLLIIWSEVTLAFSVKLSIFSIVAHDAKNVYGVIIFGTISFGYMSAASLFSLWRLRLRQMYHMHPYRQTDDKSLLGNAAMCMRLMFPLGYNFFLISGAVNRSSYCSLFSGMSEIAVIGDPANTFLPAIIAFFSLATWFNLYGKLLKWMRISRFEYGDPEKSEEVAHEVKTGKTLIKKFKTSLRTNEALREDFIDKMSHWSKSMSILSPNPAPKRDGYVPQVSLITDDALARKGVSSHRQNIEFANIEDGMENIPLG